MKRSVDKKNRKGIRKKLQYERKKTKKNGK